MNKRQWGTGLLLTQARPRRCRLTGTSGPPASLRLSMGACMPWPAAAAYRLVVSHERCTHPSGLELPGRPPALRAPFTRGRRIPAAPARPGPQ